MEEDVIVKISIDGPANEQRVTELTSEIETLTEETKKLSEANKQLTKEGKSTSDSYVQNSKQAEVNKQKIDANTASRKNLVKTLDTEKSSTLGVKDAMGTLSPALSGATTGALNLGKALLALVANPIGLVIAAIAVALGTVYTFLTRTAGGADMLEDAFTAVSTTIDVLLDRVAKLGGGLVNLFKGIFTGDFAALKEGIDGITTAFDGMGKEIAEEVSQAQKLNEAIRDLEDAEIDLEIRAAKTENTVKRLLLQARNRTITEQERLKILEQAAKEEEDLNRDRLKNAQQEIQNAADAAAARLNIRQGENQSTIAFGEQLIEAFKGQNAAQADDLRDNLKNALIAYQQVTGQSLALQEKIQNQRDAAQAKIEEEELKQIERDQKQLELDAKKAEQQQLELEAINARVQATQTEEEFLAELFNTGQLRAEAELESTNEQTEANEELKRSINAVSIARENEYKKTSALNGIYTQAANFISQIAGENKELALASVIIQKAAAIGQVIASTAIANAKAVAASPLTFGLPWTAINTASAGLSIASLVAEGAKSISEITAAAGGGDFLTKGPTLLLVGDNPGGVERVTVKPVSGKGKTVVGGNMIKAAGGVDFTSIGSLTTGSARIAESTMNVNQLASLMNMVKIAVVYDDVEAKGLTKDEITTRAQVI